jgi:hypothetical protein
MLDGWGYLIQVLSHWAVGYSNFYASYVFELAKDNFKIAFSIFWDFLSKYRFLSNKI